MIYKLEILGDEKLYKWKSLWGTNVREYYTSEDSSRTTSKLKEFWNSEGKIVATEYEKE